MREIALPESNGPSCAIVTLSDSDSAIDVRALLDRSPGVRFVFVALAPPLRHAVARIIREAGHAVVSVDEPPLVVVATVAALMAREERVPGD